jgi:hypothetical protein
MQDKPASLYTRLGGYDAIAAMVDNLLSRRTAVDFGLAPAASIRITANANWPLILSPQPREARLSTWAGT